MAEISVPRRRNRTCSSGIDRPVAPRRERSGSADPDRHGVGVLAAGLVDDPEPVHARAAGDDVGAEQTAAHRRRDREVLPTAVEALHLEPDAPDAAIDTAEVDPL